MKWASTYQVQFSPLSNSNPKVGWASISLPLATTRGQIDVPLVRHADAARLYPFKKKIPLGRLKLATSFYQVIARRSEQHRATIPRGGA